MRKLFILLTVLLCLSLQKANAQEGVEINSITWATCNVGAFATFAANPEDTGMFYQWSRRTAWAATGTFIFWNSSTPTDTSWTTANVPCPKGWRLPTVNELRTLNNESKVISKWTTLNGINGIHFTDINTGNNIFLPAAGCRGSTDGILGVVGKYGYYWSSTEYSSNNAYILYLDGNAYVGDSSKTYGFSVRCVAE